MAHDKAEGVLDAEIEKLKDDLVAERELTKAKNKTKAQFVYASDGVTKLGQQLGYYQSIIGHDYLRTFPGKVDAVTAGDIRPRGAPVFRPRQPHRGLADRHRWRRAGRWRRGGRGAVRHPRLSRGPPSPWADGPPPPPVPVPAELGPVTPIRQLQLPNGLQVILQENHAAPFVGIYGNVMAGPVFDPPGKAGLAAFTAEMLSHGTQKRTWSEIQEALEFVAAELGFGTGTQVGTVNGECLTLDLGLLLAAAADELGLSLLPAGGD